MTNLASLPLLPLWPPPRPHLRLLCCTRANRPSAAAASAPLAGRTTLALARAEHGAQDVRLQERPAAFAVEQGYPPRDRRAIAPELDLRHALEHADEPPDWPQIAALYGELARITGSAVVELNRAAAMGEAGEVEPALELVERLELDRYLYLHATRAELLRRLERTEEARAAYDRALELAESDAERALLERRLAELPR